MCQILSCILTESTDILGWTARVALLSPQLFLILISLSSSCPLLFWYAVVSLLELSEPTQMRLSPGSAKKGSYVQRWQELISNFLHNDCIISSDSGNLAYITEAAGGCRSGWQLSSPEAPLTAIRESVKEKCSLHLFTDAVSIRNWSWPIENKRFEPFHGQKRMCFCVFLNIYMYCMYNIQTP